ncbi:MAG: transposase [Burkholderiales bacterium]
MGDKGFIGDQFANDLWQYSQAQIITQKRSNMLHQPPKLLTKLIGKVRKRVETCISQLIEQFSIATTKARSYHGFLGRLNRKILAYTAALFF